MCKNMKQKKKKTNEVRSGEVMHLVMQINENNQNLILENPSLSLERLQKEIPAFDWVKGHSGALLSDDTVAKLDELCEKKA